LPSRTNEIARVVGPGFVFQAHVCTRGRAVARGAGAHHAADPVGLLAGPRLARHRGGVAHAVHHQAGLKRAVRIGGEERGVVVDLLKRDIIVDG